MKTHVLLLIDAEAYAAASGPAQSAMVELIRPHLRDKGGMPINAPLWQRDGRAVFVAEYAAGQTEGLTEARIAELNVGLAGLAEIIEMDDPAGELAARGIVQPQTEGEL